MTTKSKETKEKTKSEKETLTDKFKKYCEENPELPECRIYDI